MWTDSYGAAYVVQERQPARPGDPTPPEGAKLLEKAGGDSGKAILAASFESVFYLGGVMVTQYQFLDSSFDPASHPNGVWLEHGKRYHGNVETRLEAKQCFMPGIEFEDWMNWTTEHFTWLYIVTQDIWIVFIFSGGLAVWALEAWPR
jgi:hypothetical protein